MKKVMPGLVPGSMWTPCSGIASAIRVFKQPIVDPHESDVIFLRANDVYTVLAIVEENDVSRRAFINLLGPGGAFWVREGSLDFFMDLIHVEE